MKEASLVVIEDQCLGCMKCVRNCSFGAFEVRGTKPYINPELCQECMACVMVCPVEAIKKINM